MKRMCEKRGIGVRGAWNLAASETQLNGADGARQRAPVNHLTMQCPMRESS